MTNIVGLIAVQRKAIENRKRGGASRSMRRRGSIVGEAWWIE